MAPRVAVRPVPGEGTGVKMVPFEAFGVIA
jgi:hypothetical protein